MISYRSSHVTLSHTAPECKVQSAVREERREEERRGKERRAGTPMHAHFSIGKVDIGSGFGVPAYAHLSI